MTTEELAAGYLRKCSSRLKALKVLMQDEGYSDVVRESQEVVELALKGLLRAVGIDPPKWHDVGALLVEYSSRLPMLSAKEINYLAAASKDLRKDRELSFYGDVDFIPTKEYGRKSADKAFGHARRAARALERALKSAKS